MKEAGDLLEKTPVAAVVAAMDPSVAAAAVVVVAAVAVATLLNLHAEKKKPAVCLPLPLPPDNRCKRFPAADSSASARKTTSTRKCRVYTDVCCSWICGRKAFRSRLRSP